MNPKEELKGLGASLLEALRIERTKVISLPDDKKGKPHSHGETDNARGLRIRALSISITKMEEAMMWMNRSFDRELKEYLP